MEIESAARRYIMSDSTVAGYVQAKVFKFRLEETIEGTGGAAVVVNRGPGWAGRDEITSQEFPRLIVDAITDPTRDMGVIVRMDAEDRAFALTRAIVPLFTFPALRGVYMGGVGSNPGLLVVSSQQYSEPRIIRGADMHPAKQGDTVIVRTEFALQVAHG